MATFAEGETVPAKYEKVEDTHYLVELLETTKAAATVYTKLGARATNSNGPRKAGGPKTSPWGASPEEIAAKKKSSSAAAAAKKN